MKGIFIELANPSRSYFAGQVVQGRVIVQNDKPLKVKEVTVLLEGTGRVRWSETESYTVYETRTVNGRTERVPRTHTRVITYSANETYVSQKISLAGDGHNLMVLPEGTAVYPFQFVLPTNCPSSFTTRIGLVSYFLEAELRRPMLTPNKRMAVPFTVNGIFDLNTEYGTTLPQQLQKMKGSNCCACRKGQIGFVLSLPRRSGFVPGEILEFSSEVTNSSNKKIKGMKASLNQVVQFHARGKTKVETKVLCTVKGPEVEKGDHEMWTPNNIRIPPLPPTRLGGICRIIDVQYCIRFEVNISGLSTSLTGELPVMIGTIPLRSTFDALRYQQPQMPMPSHGTVPEMGFNLPGSSNGTFGNFGTDEKSPNHAQELVVAPSAPVLPDYPDLPPPTYEEAISSETFNWNRNDDNDAANHENAYTNNVDDTDTVPTAPPMGEFVPNYITYKSQAR